MTSPARSRCLSLLAASLAVASASPALAQSGAEDVAIAAPEPQRILRVAPPDGANVPTNARIAFSLNYGDATDIEGELAEGDDREVMFSTQVACPDVCVGLFAPSALLPGSSPTVTLGTNLDQSMGLSYTVSAQDDVTPPTLEAAPSLTSTWEAFDGEHLGYTLEVSVARASDDFGIAYYEVRTGSSATETLGIGALLLGVEDDLETFAFLEASAAQACVEVAAVDYAGHRVTGERVCEPTVPPTDEELEATIVQGGCFGGAQPALGLLGLLLLHRRRRR
jgi:hypothetical protein